MAEIKMKSVSKFFGEVKAVNKFDLVVKDGEFVSILGPSGCGKTTMLRMIAGFEKPSEGEIWIGDELVSSAAAGRFTPPEKRNIGMVFQSYAVWPHMNVFKNVAYPLVIKNVSQTEITTRVKKVLELVHLNGYEERLPNQLSGGQQQRVALARALVSEPKLLLLDEPLSNLDAKLRESMRFEIKDLQSRLKITVIYVTHDQAEAMAMSDRIAVMHLGEIQQKEDPVSVYEHPANDTVAEFIGLVNFLPAEIKEGKINFTTLDFAMNHTGEEKGSVKIAVRPEHIVINKNGTGIKGKLARKFYLGDSTDCRVQCGSETLRVIEKGAAFQNYQIGDEVWLKFEKINIFLK